MSGNAGLGAKPFFHQVPPNVLPTRELPQRPNVPFHDERHVPYETDAERLERHLKAAGYSIVATKSESTAATLLNVYKQRKK